MTAFGLPGPMFWVFVATIVAGSLGALHFLIVHVALGRPVVETLPPALAREGQGAPGTGSAEGGGPE
ncbi:MAG: hypothetical protein KJP18_15335 [Gemmatimonadetes bacterium]|nr:hypothetical protein [Gemmatimonadota bacterium]